MALWLFSPVETRADLLPQRVPFPHPYLLITDFEEICYSGFISWLLSTA